MHSVRTIVGLALAILAIAAVSGAVSAAPADPPEDTIGWEDGIWYNESIDVDASDGLDADEREAVVSRTMARVEVIRDVEFERRPPVRVITRDEHAADVSSGYTNVSREERLLDNVAAESLFLVGESTDVTAIQERHSTGNVKGYYESSEGAITLVSENATHPKIDEITLSQELYHALQDQQFDIPGPDNRTTEAVNARNGIVEGDGNYVDYLYEQRCREDWADTCLQPQDKGSSSNSSSDPHVGLFQIQYMPYSSGPAFVRHLRNEGGWDAVDAVYDDPPESTEQVIHPDAYGTDAPTEVTVEDRSTESWTRLNRTDAPNYDSFGEAGWFVALWYPSQETGGEKSVIPRSDHIRYNDSTGRADELAPYAYDHRFTAGWDGDRMVPYVTDESAETNETGYVAKFVWDSPEEAREFQEGYRQLLGVREAQAVVGYDNVYRITEGPFADAFAVERTEATVRIVNAPSIDALEAVHAGSVREVPTTGTVERGDLEPITDESSGFGPGPGPALALVIAFVTLLGLARWRRT
ncbi:MAG: Hvo_1808 family surface protein [Halococcoides sp.]